MKTNTFFISALVVGAMFTATGKTPAGVPSAPKVLYVDSERGDDASRANAFGITGNICYVF